MTIREQIETLAGSHALSAQHVADILISFLEFQAPEYPSVGEHLAAWLETIREELEKTEVKLEDSDFFYRDLLLHAVETTPACKTDILGNGITGNTVVRVLVEGDDYAALVGCLVGAVTTDCPGVIWSGKVALDDAWLLLQAICSDEGPGYVDIRCIQSDKASTKADISLPPVTDITKPVVFTLDGKGVTIVFCVNSTEEKPDVGN